MNIYIDALGGGIFSKLMLVLQSIETQVRNVDAINNIYIEVNDARSAGYPFYGNPFNYVFEQDVKLHYETTIPCMYLPAFDNNAYFLNSHTLVRLRTIASKLQIKESVLSKVPDFKGNTLGVHVRLTDMPQCHPEHGSTNTGLYLKKIEEALLQEHFDNIFVASDNEKSISLIKAIYPNIVVNSDISNRNPDESAGDYFEMQLRELHSEKFWISTFVDMLSLSKCNTLVYRLSNFNNAATVFSETLTKSHKVQSI